ncbi:SulP family inorganic anion transporter [Sulfuriferula nivalis]|uniref:Sodium-independent anion transporter n=1 Tax=Sulfuriferula nivalis TaxID=2675298 RepID=A0A809RF88_9PROT|nr:SulP family inorganic anion transporter [Sulfuriferula nivalis]BBP00265.1 sodium-independent anion transporter [Sulfuriferula nivalis]
MVNRFFKSTRVRNAVFPFMAWWSLLDRATVKNDTIAGITAGVLILPQAIALATLAGLPPEYGLYTAIFPVIITALYGSSWHSLSGPNTALAVLTAMTIAPFANIGSPDYIQYAITLTFMAGVLQLAFGVLRLGVVFNYFSHSVMVALVTGVGIIIVIQQVGNFLGVVMNLNETLDQVVYQIFLAIPRANHYAVMVGATTVISGLLIKRFRPKWPHYIMAVAIGMIAAWVIGMLVGSGTARIDMLGFMKFSAVPFSSPDFSPEDFGPFANFAYPAAIGMAVLGLMQSSVIARSMAAKSGQQGLDMNQEVIGQGLSNILGSFLSCFTSCASFNRSAANIEAGAKTPLAGLISAFALALLVFVAAPVIAYLPVSVMAGVLFLVGSALVKVKDIRHLLAIKDGGRVVFLLVLFTTLGSGVDDGVYLGIFLSIVGYLRNVSKPSLELVFEREKAYYLSAGMELDDTTAIAISGSLFFGSSHNIERALINVAKDDHRQANLIVMAEHATSIDISSAEVLVQEARRRQANKYRMSLWVRPGALEDPQVVKVLEAALGAENIFCSGRAKKSIAETGLIKPATREKLI